MYASLDLEGRLPIPAPPTCSADLVYTEVVKEGEEEVRGFLCCFPLISLLMRGRVRGEALDVQFETSFIHTV